MADAKRQNLEEYVWKIKSEPKKQRKDKKEQDIQIQHMMSILPT